MLPVMFKNNWFPTMFEDFLNSDIMPRTNTTAPAVNVREDEKAYTMEVAAPGIKKEFCRVSINDEGNLCVAIENKMEHKKRRKSTTICAASSPTRTTSRTTLCPRTWTKTTSKLKWSTESSPSPCRECRKRNLNSPAPSPSGNLLTKANDFTPHSQECGVFLCLQYSYFMYLCSLKNNSYERKEN